MRQILGYNIIFASLVSAAAAGDQPSYCQRHVTSKHGELYVDVRQVAATDIRDKKKKHNTAITVYTQVQCERTVVLETSVERRPGRILVSKKHGVVVFIDRCGMNHDLLEGAPALSVLKLTGKEVVSITLRQVLDGPPFGVVDVNSTGVKWLRTAWIDEAQEALVVVTSKEVSEREQPQVRRLDLQTGQISDGNVADIVRGLNVLRSDMLIELLAIVVEYAWPDARDSLIDLFSRDTTVSDVRIRAAIALSRIGDNRGKELVRAALQSKHWRCTQRERTGADNDRSWLMWYLPDVLGDEAIAVLIAELKKQSCASVAEEVLVNVGAPAVPDLIHALGSDKEYTRFHAARALGRIGAPAKSARESLLRALADRSEAVRDAAREAVTSIGE